MTPLERILKAEIAQTGPIPVSRFMEVSLQHPTHGYYTTRDPLGAAGDFTTAPEISQMFGEMLGLFLAQVWMDQGMPAPFNLAELGPGRGTLMADVLRATRGVPGFHAAARVALVETSPALRAKQAEALTGHAPIWHDTVTTLPEGPLFLLANEFFDALPIRQFVRDGAAWRERMVGLEGDALAFGLSPAQPLPWLDALFPATPPDTLVEYRPAQGMMETLAARLRAGGVAVIIDYGDWDGTGDTIQALHQHEMIPPLTRIGAADLTSHVNFSHLAAWAAPMRGGFTTQGAFLERLGITARAQALARAPDAAERIATQHRRLTHGAEMGTLFKVLALCDPARPGLPGFD
ncbi:SAM-dependent MidA family methyltransferase [Rubricella aquisinus]|uniref:SAM-dependent MidA family methyltransferase n=1 Tax=Rubricella aquisinus TaxID=2028108 RepID=A0A840WYW1_9RHOB|nr:SAM-dependent methyltransferase [Rubricella aquisinus]MBB5515594.1 SAM-dependent MidA family methyltransferase [Rubricella aquisinus]